jgi:hypothetical protein
VRLETDTLHPPHPTLTMTSAVIASEAQPSPRVGVMNEISVIDLSKTFDMRRSGKASTKI